MLRGHIPAASAVLMLALGLAVSAATTIPQPSPPPEAFLDHLTGTWVLRGSMGTVELHQTVEAEWVVQGHYLRMHMIDTEPPEGEETPYEAVYLIGYDEEAGEYLFHFEYPDGLFANTFVRIPDEPMDSRKELVTIEPRISMITLGVRDLEASVRFYEEGLGFPRLESAPQVAFFTLDGTWLGLYEREALAEDATVPGEGSGFAGFTLAHNVSSEARVDEVMEQAVTAGATLVKEPQDVFWGGYSGYFADPDGHLWEVAHNPQVWIGPPEEKA